MKQGVNGIAGVRRTGPHRHRKQHDVGGGETGHGQTAQKLPPGVLPAIEGFGSEFSRLEANPAKRIDKRRGSPLCFLEDHSRPASGKIGPRRGYAGDLKQRFLNLAHTAAARHVLDGERYRLVPAHRSNGCADCGYGWSGGAC